MITQKNQKIQFNENTSICNSDCPVSKLCANHSSASLQRKEDGMTPNVKWDNNLGSWACQKIDTKVNYGYIKYDHKRDKMEPVYSSTEEE